MSPKSEAPTSSSVDGRPQSNFLQFKCERSVVRHAYTDDLIDCALDSSA